MFLFFNFLYIFFTININKHFKQIILINDQKLTKPNLKLFYRTFLHLHLTMLETH